MSRMLIVITLVALLTFCVGVAVGTQISPAKPGGVWTEAPPAEITGPFTIRVRAYKTNPWDPEIAYVNFTMKTILTPPGPWDIPCHPSQPVRDDEYECPIDPLALNIPPGTVEFSFDVYDHGRLLGLVKGKNLAPNGTKKSARR